MEPARSTPWREPSNAAGIAPPEGRAWYKTTVEAYLRHEGDERLSVLGKLAPSRFAARQQTEARPQFGPSGDKSAEAAGTQQPARESKTPPPLAGAGRGAPDTAVYPAWRITGEAVNSFPRHVRDTNNSMPRSGSYLGPSLGCRDPDHIAGWVASRRGIVSSR